MITDPDDYFARGCGRCARFDSDACVTRKWAAGLEALRRLCLGAGLVETAKWGHPCYMAGGRNVALIGALNGDFRLNFFEAALMADPAGVMERQGPNTRHPDSIKFTENGQVAAMAATVAAYLAEAKAHAEAGRRAPREAGEVDLPAELAESLEADPELAEAFHALTPGRQRSYVINLAGAKAAQTRIRRIAGFRSRILAGKGAQER
ncbi:YdeI/OmpD-associated family protein [Paragemmobacter straminiformis]|uniref:YdeI/OmpD-associated family protein n=1 Tax=Paragemmobacter straminiformis TaxID=2045119 RepID=A0A842I6Z9_9RHOB|nr:YdeI/OmpD-associated family protein [Gemmobacter straminiformis]MBC2834854.1 YdeI/OmpD-associated family protein [Gemmobacter straminiformis]